MARLLSVYVIAGFALSAFSVMAAETPSSPVGAVSAHVGKAQVSVEIKDVTRAQIWTRRADKSVRTAPAHTRDASGAFVSGVSGKMAAADADLSAPDPAKVAALIKLTEDPNTFDPTAVGLSSGGLPTAIQVPDMADMRKETAVSIAAAFSAPENDGTADGASTYAAAATTGAAAVGGDAEFEERVALARQLFIVDGTDAIIRKFVGTQHMALIIREVNNYIDISKLSEADRYRLAGIAAQAQTELEDRILTLNAQTQARALTKADLVQLIRAYDIPAQKKLTTMRLADDGKLDRVAGLDINIAQFRIVKEFELAQ